MEVLGEILICSSRDEGSSFNYKRKERTRSRLIDPPPEKSGRMQVGGRSGELNSGAKEKGNAAEEEEDDPFGEEHLPEEFKDKLDVWTLLEWVSLFLIISASACSFAIPSFRNKHLCGLMLWKWEVPGWVIKVLVFICGRLVSGWVIKVPVFFIERNLVLRKRVLYFVYEIRKPVRNCLWVGFVLIAWNFLFDGKVKMGTRSWILHYVNKILVWWVVGTLLRLVKTLVVKVLALSFHVSTYFDRIQESLLKQHVIGILSRPPVIEIKRLIGGSDGLQKSPRITPRLSHVISSKSDDGNEGITLDQLRRLSPKNVSAWNMNRLINIVRHGALSTLDEGIHNSNSTGDSGTEIRSEYEAKVAARKIFENVTRPGSRYIHSKDVMRFMAEEEAEETMSLFEGAPETKKIGEECLKNWVVNAFRERKTLALTLNDTETAVDILNRMVNVLVGIVIVVVGLLILGTTTPRILYAANILALAFMFRDTCKKVLEAVIFLFVIHPFDVGDRCEIDGVQMMVEEMNILTTVFLRFDNQKIIISNNVLANKVIGFQHQLQSKKKKTLERGVKE